jgi:DNA-binding beta-propeller fold protein YncE
MSKRKAWIAALVTCLLLPAASLAQGIYVAAMRGQAGASNVMSGLYSINLSNGAATFVAPLRTADGSPVAITGLGVEPASHVFYGITSGLSPTAPQSLVTLEPQSGRVNVIGRLDKPGTDIVFDKQGRLFIWLPGTRQVGLVDLATGHVKALGKAGPPDAFGGLAVDAEGKLYVTPSGAYGTLDTIDLETGALVKGPQIKGSPFPGAITAMTFTPSGLLIAINSNVGSPAAAKLVTINTSTGAGAEIGNLPEDSDAITYAAPPHGMSEMLGTLSGRTLALFALITGLVLAVGGMFAVRWIRGRRA